MSSLLKPSQAAALASVAPETLRAWRASGRLTFGMSEDELRHPRYRVSEVTYLALVKALTTAGLSLGCAFELANRAESTINELAAGHRDWSKVYVTLHPRYPGEWQGYSIPFAPYASEPDMDRGIEVMVTIDLAAIWRRVSAAAAAIPAE
ncbi:MerR family transcriptional regulator [Ancylobacter dichloromethanicus]|uniref:HTH merR-type domain-containing protein n=1 Tax=Ancylobacter dichloromethanicus TaxID=518825 RepID=A0A9W6J6J5_9HYPH|nr:MerR family transcriptional regulator [Ancylobacter dichloromethanicus]MBS7554167.1 MerR family transcriptional regulator [Ancylobacter dichloromethanicus]GLK71287.1 hypothetical protein GCM10017643_14020 [Ancylobacter dichloromethanicus]